MTLHFMHVLSVHITFHAHSDHMINATYIKREGYTVGYMACHDITFHAYIYIYHKYCIQKLKEILDVVWHDGKP